MRRGRKKRGQNRKKIKQEKEWVNIDKKKKGLSPCVHHCVSTILQVLLKSLKEHPITYQVLPIIFSKELQMDVLFH